MGHWVKDVNGVVLKGCCMVEVGEWVRASAEQFAESNAEWSGGTFNEGFMFLPFDLKPWHWRGLVVVYVEICDWIMGVVAWVILGSVLCKESV